MKDKYYVRSVVSKKPKIKYDYYQVDTGRKVSDKKLIGILDEIKIPPTYTHVVMSPSSERRLQATAHDGTGRRQYFYSQAHLDSTRKEKYQNLIFLGLNLDKLIGDLRRLTKGGGRMSLDSLNALALQTMLLCNFRVGTTQNRDKYGTYGLSTLMPSHVSFGREGAKINFVGKKKQVNESVIGHPEMVKMLKRLVSHNHGEKGATLFSWDGMKVTPQSMNEFLQRYHPDITTKTWRTWFANTAYLTMMRRLDSGSESDGGNSKKERKSDSNQVVKLVASDLHHTPAVCKKNYLMTELIDLYVDHPEKWNRLVRGTKNADEMFMKFLKEHYQIDKKWIERRSRESSRKYSRGASRDVSRGAISRGASRESSRRGVGFAEGISFSKISRLPIKVFETKSLSLKADKSFQKGSSSGSVKTGGLSKKKYVYRGGRQGSNDDSTSSSS